MNYFPTTKKNKYHAKKTEVAGMVFDSKKEANRFMELQLLEKAGLISDLKRQVKFELIPKTATERPCNYYADFVYTENCKLVAEDCKGYRTKEYLIKRKLMKWRYPDYMFRES